MNDEAISDLNLAIQQNEEYVKAYVKRGDLYLQLEKYEEAIRDYEKAKQIDVQFQGISQKIKHAKLGLKKSKRKDYYKLLEVSKDANDDEIKKAYKKAALKWHPDKHTNSDPEQHSKAEVMFKDIGEGYAILSDPQKRAKYDQGADLEEIE